MNRLQKLVIEAKNRPCFDCGGRFPYYVMDLDHRGDEPKSFSLGMAYSGPKTRAGRTFTEDEVIAEIAKCDPVCKACHARRTMRRAMELRGDVGPPA